MAENGVLEKIRMGEGCGYGHENRMMMEATDKQVDDMKECIEKFRAKMELNTYLLIVLCFIAGGDVVTRLLALLK